LYFDPPTVLDYFERYGKLSDELKRLSPELYSDISVRAAPHINETSDNDGRGYVDKKHLRLLLMDIEEIFELRANSQIGSDVAKLPRKIFISHGRSPDWHKVQAYIEKDIRVATLELAQEANRGRTVLQKLNEEAARCSYAVIVMTGDDDIGADEPPRTRENVMHEIGFFQGRYGLEGICLLYEEGTSIPSNIHGLVYVPYPKGYVEATFGALRREIEAALTRHDSQ
jgi:predicted nucleotide-binding protein